MDNKNVKKANDQNIKDLIKQTRVSLVKVGAEWCGPCRMIAPVLEKIANEHGHINIIEVDLEAQDARHYVEENKVQMIPTLIFYVDGVEKEKRTGFLPEQKILEIIETISKNE